MINPKDYHIDDTEIDDPETVCAVAQVFDRCSNEMELKGVGIRLRKESLSENDRAILARVYKECRRALRIVR